MNWGLVGLTSVVLFSGGSKKYSQSTNSENWDRDYVSQTQVHYLMEQQKML